MSSHYRCTCYATDIFIQYIRIILYVYWSNGHSYQQVLVRINLPLFSTIVPSSIIVIDGTTVENKGKLILTDNFPSVQKHDCFSIKY